MTNHGMPKDRLTGDLDEARDVMVRLAAAGVDMKAVTAKLLDDDVREAARLDPARTARRLTGRGRLVRSDASHGACGNSSIWPRRLIDAVGARAAKAPQASGTARKSTRRGGFVVSSS